MRDFRLLTVRSQPLAHRGSPVVLGTFRQRKVLCGEPETRRVLSVRRRSEVTSLTDRFRTTSGIFEPQGGFDQRIRSSRILEVAATATPCVHALGTPYLPSTASSGVGHRR